MYNLFPKRSFFCLFHRHIVFDVNTLTIDTKVAKLSVKHVFYPQIPYTFTSKLQSQTKQRPLSTLNLNLKNCIGRKSERELTNYLLED